VFGGRQQNSQGLSAGQVNHEILGLEFRTLDVKAVPARSDGRFEKSVGRCLGNSPAVHRDAGAFDGIASPLPDDASAQKRGPGIRRGRWFGGWLDVA
jgi:hypothetical protein